MGLGPQNPTGVNLVEITSEQFTLLTNIAYMCIDYRFTSAMDEKCSYLELSLSETYKIHFLDSELGVINALVSKL